MNLPFNLPSEPIPDDPSSSKGPFSKDDVPPNAPPELVALAANISELLNTISGIRGELYANLVGSLITVHQNVLELEKFSCQNLSDHPNHPMIHTYAGMVNAALGRIALLLETSVQFSGINGDLTTVTSRLNKDWHSKRLY